MLSNSTVAPPIVGQERSSDGPTNEDIADKFVIFQASCNSFIEMNVVVKNCCSFTVLVYSLMNALSQ